MQVIGGEGRCGFRLSEHSCGAPAEPGEAGDVTCRAVEVLAPELDGRIELVIDYHRTLGHPGQPTAQGYEFRGGRRLVPGPRWRSTSTASFSVS
jgi:hypothetical protein